MAASAINLTNDARVAFFGDLNFSTDTVKAILLSDAYTIDNTNSTFADISGNEITDADYEQQDVTNKSVTFVSGDVVLDCDDVEFGADVTIEAKFLALVKTAGSSPVSTDLLVGVIDLDDGTTDPVKSVNSVFRVSISDNGLISSSLA